MVAEPTVDIDVSGRAGPQERLLVEFELDGEGYGVDIADIREIIRYQPITVVPGAPEIVEGIINLRGRVTPIVDLRKRVGLRASEVDDATRIIVIEVDEALVGVHVDAVTGVVGLTAQQLQALSTEVTTARSSYLEGVADVDGRLIVLINLQHALEGGADKITPARQRERPSEHSAAEIEAEIEAADAAGSDAALATDEAPGDTGEGVAPVAEDVADVATTTSADADAGDGDAAAAALGLRVELLEQSFEAVKPQAEALVQRFYENLFEQHPAVRSLFPDDMSEQQGKLLSALATVVASLRRPDVLVPHLEELGRRHVAYGAVPAHYEAVGTVLVETLGEIAGDLWTDELRDAWSDAISLVATVMIDAAAAVEAPATAAAPTAVATPTATPAPAKKAASRRATTRKPAAKARAKK
jgi:chemotaxis signal transduction protein/hemoglobin-like flavoprotein